MAHEKPDMNDIPLDADGDVGPVEDSRALRTTDELKSGRRKGLRQVLKDPHYRRKLWHTVWLAGTFFSLGMTAGQEGPALLDLQILTNTKLEKSSAFFTGNAIGYLAGALVCGAVFEKINSNFFLVFATCGLGLIAIVTPYCSIYVVMIAIRSLAGSCRAIINTAGNTVNMRLWGNEGKAFMQLLHFCFALGGIISPLYTEPFLAKKPNETQEIDSNFSAHLQAPGYNVTAGFPGGNFTAIKPLSSFPESTDVLIYAFVITAVCSFVSAVPFIVLLLKTLTKQQKSKAHRKVTQRKLPLPLLLFILATMGSFYLLYSCVQKTFASFLMTFLVNEYDFMTKSDGAYMTAIHWASLAASRFLMMFLAKFLSAVRLLYICCTLTVIAYSGFLLSALLGAVDALAVCTAMAGMGLSGLFAAGFSWTESELLRVTGRVSSCFLMFASLGNIINPLVLGYLMEEVSNMWFCYQLLGLTLLMCFIFVFLLLFNRFYVNKHYGPIPSVIPDVSHQIREQETVQPLNVHVANDSGEDRKLTKL